MAYRTLIDKIRKDPLGFGFLNLLNENMRAAELLAAVAHTQDGLHNSLDVARAVGTITYSAGVYSIAAGSSALITAVSGSAGVVTITLATDKFTTPMAVKTTPLVTTLPVMTRHEVVSATSVKVYLSTIGSLAENLWITKDTSFAIAIHSEPVTPTGTAISFATNSYRGQTLGFSGWDTLVTGQATQQANLLVGHTAAGVHNLRDVAYGYAQMQLDAGGTTYTKLYGENVTSVTRTSAGVLTLNISGARYSAALQPFFQVGHKSQASGSAADVHLVGYADTISATALPLRIWKWDSGTNTWAAADADFSVTIHAAAA